MKTERALFLVMSFALAACADTNTKVEVETETHFLQSCERSCQDGLSCICGVCTEPCTSDSACEGLASSASCAAIPSACGHLGNLCDVICSDAADCDALGAGYACDSGRCRAEGDAGTSGSGGGGGDGAAGSGGASGGSGGQSGIGPADGGPVDAGLDSGPDAGGDASADGDCDAVGDTCCDPFPGDGPNYCTGAMIECGPVNQCESICACNLPVILPICGVDGVTYDACERECISVEIACEEECPCGSSYCAVACTGAAPDQEVVDACQAIGEQAACQSYESAGFPTSCRWVTPSSEPCPLVPGTP
jgi:hypothetical protein